MTLHLAPRTSRLATTITPMDLSPMLATLADPDAPLRRRVSSTSPNTMASGHWSSSRGGQRADRPLWSRHGNDKRRSSRRRRRRFRGGADAEGRRAVDGEIVAAGRARPAGGLSAAAGAHPSEGGGTRAGRGRAARRADRVRRAARGRPGPDGAPPDDTPRPTGRGSSIGAFRLKAEATGKKAEATRRKTKKDTPSLYSLRPTYMRAQPHLKDDARALYPRALEGEVGRRHREARGVAVSARRRSPEWRKMKIRGNRSLSRRLDRAATDAPAVRRAAPRLPRQRQSEDPGIPAPDSIRRSSRASGSS